MENMNKKGFTLIELLAVILILGIIALIAIPTVNTVIMEARIGAWKATANQVIKSYQQYGQLCDMRPACEKLTSFKESTDEGYVEGENDLLGSTVKKELEINGDMPNAFDSLGLTEMGDAYVAFVEDGVACWNYGETGKYPTAVGSAVENTTKIFDMVCMKASDAEADAE